MGITAETRRESYGAVKPTRNKRRTLILEILGDKEMTANEIAWELFTKGHTPFYERNFAAPRLTELKEDGIVETIGKKYCQKTGRLITVWKKVNKEGEENAT